MRLFISYARVDKPYCLQIVEMLDVHEVWFDKRLTVGQPWWEEICRQVGRCEGFVYLLSPESVESEYCNKEFEMAISSGKNVFPVLIHPDVKTPEKLKHIQYADLTKGLTPEGVKVLLNSILVAERKGARSQGSQLSKQEPAPVSAPAVNPTTVMSDVVTAIQSNQYDKAVYILKQAQEEGVKPRFVNIEAVLQEAESALEKQAYLREAKREYEPIVSLVKTPKTRKLGCKAFQQFREHFPDYDPENLSAVCATVMMPMLDWCTIPEGETTIRYDQKTVTYFVESFKMSKYPVTNAQFQAFAEAPDGFANAKWWDFSPQARAWREQHQKPVAPKFAWGDHPRANVCWYEAMAFCAWLSEKTGLRITLPTEQQWQRSAQGDDNRAYPWGSKFDKERCNTRDSKLRMTCPVTRYPDDVSPFGVSGLAGNVWQWCRNTDYGKNSGTTLPGGVDLPRAVRGGSFISVPQRSRTTFHFYLNPLYRYATIGFRVAAME